MEKIVGDYSTEVKLTDEEANNICHIGQGAKCCAFLVMAPTGFECIRMSYPANGSIFTRLKAGTMTAKGEGGWKGCA
jgi:hypothetical protein